MSDVSQAELALENAKELLEGPNRNTRIHEAEQRLYRAQKREFEASIKRRAKSAKAAK